MEQLDPQQTALLFFDSSNRYIKHKDGTVKDQNKSSLANQVRLMEIARKNDMMIAYAAANHRSDNATSGRVISDTDMLMNPIPPGSLQRYDPGVHQGTWEAEIVDELKPRSQDYMVPKYRWNAFYQTYLDLALRSRGINTVIISGGATEIGIASTVYSGRDMDYSMVVVSDACTSLQQEAQDLFMTRIFPRFARIRTTDQIVTMLS